MTRTRSGVALLLAALVAAACTGDPPARRASATPAPTPAFTLKIFNLRAVGVATSGNFHVRACGALEVSPEIQSRPPGEISIDPSEAIVDLPPIRTPIDYRGIVSVIIDSRGARTALGDTTLAALPPCEAE